MSDDAAAPAAPAAPADDCTVTDAPMDFPTFGASLATFARYAYLATARAIAFDAKYAEKEHRAYSATARLRLVGQFIATALQGVM